MSGRAVVVDGHHGVHVFLAECAHQIVGTLLHLGVGTLHGVQLNAVAVATGVHARHAAAAQTDAVVVATHHHHLVAGLWLLLQTVALGAVAHAACQHDDLVVGIFCRNSGCIGRHGLLMLEGEYGAADEGLSELVAEVRGTVGCLDENLFGALVEPLANGQDVFPVSIK